MTAATRSINLEHLDRTISPAENFYQFANGGWLAANPIPPEYSRWGSFEQLNESSLSQQRAILEDCVATATSGTTTASNISPNSLALATLYSTGLDEAGCTRHGVEPLADVFSAIDAVQSPRDLFVLSASLRSKSGVPNGLFNVYSLPDAKNSSWEILAVTQSGSLGIGDRDFYFREDKEEIREKYVAHVASMLAFVPGSPAASDPTVAKEQAGQMMALETKLAESCMSKTERRDPLKTYNKFEGPAALAARTDPHGPLPWADFFRALGLPDDALATIIVDNPAFFECLGKLLNETPLPVWRVYFRYHILKHMAAYINPEVEAEHFAFFGTVMTGQPEMKPRWKRVLNSGVTEMLEDCLGILYTEKHFSANAKQACLDMVNVLIDVWRERIEKVDWMQRETKDKGLHKLSKFRPLIGYPNKWEVEDIPELVKELSMNQSYATNVRACNRRNFRMMIERINKPVDGDRWEMPCTMVNAYFHPLKNVIVFPAAILQPPFFYHPTPEQPHGDPAINFSAIGAVICHEISHGYDDQGRKFDAQGELVDWWTETDAAEYERRTSNMEKLCSDYEFFGKKLNGKLCLGENIADYGGVKLSFRGLQEFQEKHGKLPTIDGFTPEQRFFLGWAIIWRNNIREENALQRIIMDPHAPGEFRANIVKVVEEFHQAFDVKEGDAMWTPPVSRCDIW